MESLWGNAGDSGFSGVESGETIYGGNNILPAAVIVFSRICIYRFRDNRTISPLE
jgi:hypothetical protein